MNNGLSIVFFFLLVLFTPVNVEAQWVEIASPSERVYEIIVKETDLYAATITGVYRSTDYGSTWNLFGLGNYFVTNIRLIDSSMFVSVPFWDGGSYTYRYDGTSWVPCGLPEGFTSIIGINKTLLASTIGSGIYRSSDNGATWLPSRAGLPVWNVHCLFAYPPFLFAGVGGKGVFRSTDFGSFWYSSNSGISGPLSEFPETFLSVDSLLYVGAGAGIFLSVDSGRAWTPRSTGLGGNGLRHLAVSSPYLFAGTSQGGVYTSSNGGMSWRAFNAGLISYTIFQIIPAGPYLFAATYGGLWRRLISDVTSVERINTSTPTNHTLNQNYPNPFNSSTRIQFSLAHEDYVTLRVFNLLGAEVASLLSQELHAGTYSTTWNANGVASGIYFYRLQAGEFVETKKMVVVK